MFESASPEEIKNLPGLRDLSYGHRIRWADLYRSFQDQGMTIMLYPAHFGIKQRWHLYLDSDNYKSPFSKLLQIQFAGKEGDEQRHIANIDLSILFHPDTQLSEKTWQDLTEQLSEFILCISSDEISRLTKHELKDYLIFYHRVISNFPFIDLFKSIKISNQSNVDLHERLAQQLWNLFKAWVFAIRQMGRFLPLRMSIENQLFDFPDPLTLKRHLPSAQYLYILLKSLCIRVLDYGNGALIQRWLDNAHEEVQKRINAQHEIIYKAFDREIKKGERFDQISSPKDMNALKNGFLDLVKVDLDLLLYQEVIEDQSKTQLIEHFHLSMQEQLFAKKNEFQTWVNSAISHSIIDRMMYLSALMAGSHNEHMRPNILQTLHPQNLERFFAHKKTITSFQQLLSESSIPEEKLTKARETTKSQWQDYFLQISNQFTYPLFKYTIDDKQLVPQWNLLPLEIGEELMAEHTNWAEKVRENRKQLAGYLKTLESQKSSNPKGPAIIPTELKNNPTARKVISKYNDSIDIFKAYREQKMLEFGILESKKLSSKNGEIWLNEMLQIEKEISPYIIFVKKAFQAALPVRKRVVINHDRHSADGVDFDPQTTQDPQKWMRGDIMTTLTTKIKRGNAAQINCFVLDASGSMEHDRMRNLFKILCLMVFGLEDRKSFDAFHFFSYTFIEAATFSGDYTNRSLLFKILQSVSKIEDGAVRFAGEGGTNMGQGIKECHNRIQAFHEALLEKNPETLYLKSLFVITDGEPSVGIIDPKILNKEIKKRRGNGEVAIKGIYLKPEDEPDNKFSFMSEIFGKDEFVETDEFATAINELVYIMAQTYKTQRVNMRYQNKK